MIRFLIILATIINLLQGGERVKIASYNVENLFDLHYDGSEYLEYIPNSSWRWNPTNYKKKLKNIAKVIVEIEPDVIALQEIESLSALKDLKKEIKRQGLYFKYHAFAGGKNTTVKNALLSRYPIVYAREVPVSANRKYRAILEVRLDIDGESLYLFNNHWKSKSGPESRRIVSAKALRKRLDNLGHDKQIVLLGDFNSHYEEYILFKKKRKHNDTKGITGINHILKTLCDDKPTTPIQLQDTHKSCYYNLWYELPEDARWSYIFRGKKEGLDQMIISKGLNDKKGIEYKKNSFNHFTPDYLFKKRYIFRWQKSKKYPKHHMGEGYSDHLPIYATFICK
ncbi:MAG: endonuclease/exonuclease/phosphatase family protein [Campylobacterota bacterium]|nr:endonuclease/exonuclease/phosphatase family protein [Campylobacterota bacterium]